MSQCDGDRHKLTFRRLKTFSFLITILARFLDVSRAMVFLKRVASAFRGVWGEVSSSPTEKTQTRRSKERKRRSVGVIGGRANKKSERRRSGDRAKLRPPCEVPHPGFWSGWKRYPSVSFCLSNCRAPRAKQTLLHWVGPHKNHNSVPCSRVNRPPQFVHAVTVSAVLTRPSPPSFQCRLSFIESTQTNRFRRFHFPSRKQSPDHSHPVQ